MQITRTILNASYSNYSQDDNDCCILFKILLLHVALAIKIVTVTLEDSAKQHWSKHRMNKPAFR